MFFCYLVTVNKDLNVMSAAYLTTNKRKMSCQEDHQCHSTSTTGPLCCQSRTQKEAKSNSVGRDAIVFEGGKHTVVKMDSNLVRSSSGAIIQ